MKILIIEDDNNITKAIGFAFQVGWPTIKLISAEWGQEGLGLVEKESPDIVILDLGLPDMNGLDVIKQIRLFSQIPILVLTVDTDETTIVQALELGANEYITKPFRQMELIARVKSLVKWQKANEGGESLIWGPFLFDYSRRELIRNNTVTNLTCLENDIFNVLVRNSPHVVPYNKLINAVWGDDYDGAMKCLKVHIRHLREKVESNPSKPIIVLTKAGIGYYAIRPQ